MLNLGLLNPSMRSGQLASTFTDRSSVTDHGIESAARRGLSQAPTLRRALRDADGLAVPDAGDAAQVLLNPPLHGGSE